MFELLLAADLKADCSVAILIEHVEDKVRVRTGICIRHTTMHLDRLCVIVRDVVITFYACSDTHIRYRGANSHT